MTLKEGRRYDMLARVSAFGAKRARLFPPSSLAGRTFAAVTRIVADLSQHSAARLSAGGHVRERTVNKALARQQLKESLQAVRRAACAMAIDSPGLDRKFVVPRSMGEGVLLSAAAAFQQHAREQAATFIAHGLPARFLKDLSDDVECLERAILRRSVAKGEWLSRGGRVQEALREGWTAVRRLDGIVPNVLRGTPSALAAWKRARRVVRRATPRRKVVSRRDARSTAGSAIGHVA